MTRFPIPPAAAEDLRRADGVLRRRLGRQVLAAHAEYLERTYLTPAEVAQVLADLAEQWGRDAGARAAAELAAACDPGPLARTA